MNISTIKKLVLPLFAAAIFTACDKPVTTDQLADKGQNIIRVSKYGGVDANFPNSALILDLQSSTPVNIEFQLEYVGSQVFGQDLTITVGVNDPARVNYNTTATDPYDPIDASLYTLSSTTTTIKAGDVFSTPITLTLLDPSQFDAAISYMLPISITNVSGGSNGVKGAPSTGTAFFHIIGNPLAGAYTSTGYFYHPTVPRAIPANTKDLLPNSPDELFCDLGDLGYAGYVALFKTNPTTNKVTIRVAPGYVGGPYTQFDDALPNSSPGYTPAWPGSAQCNNTYNPTTKTFKVRYGYVGGTGWRVTEEFLVKQ